MELEKKVATVLENSHLVNALEKVYTYMTKKSKIY